MSVENEISKIRSYEHMYESLTPRESRCECVCSVWLTWRGAVGGERTPFYRTTKICRKTAKPFAIGPSHVIPEQRSKMICGNSDYE